MGKSRLEAFSDGVLAVIITIMVLELKVPHAADLHALMELAPAALGYVLSFIYIGIYWNNHHHLIHATKKVSGWMMWANLHLLFWLSLVPFGTAWMGDSHVAPLPTATYGFIQMMAGVAYYILETTLIKAQGPHSQLKEALGSDFKGKISVVFYAIAIAIAWRQPWIAAAIYVGVAAMWLVPDRRIENRIAHV